MTVCTLRRLPRRRALLAAGAGTALVLGLAACTGGQRPASDAADAHAPHAGQYAVAKAGPNVTEVQHVTAGGYSLVAAGEPVVATLPGGSSTVEVSGPDVQLPYNAPGTPIAGEDAHGELTVTFTRTTGSLPVRASDFLALDEDQSPIALTPDRATLTAAGGTTETLHLSGLFHTGHTTLTWQPEGKPLVTWDFTIEID